MEDENFRYYSDSNGFGNIVQRTNKATGEQQVYDYWTDGKMRKLTKYELVPHSTTTMEVDYYFDALGRRVAKKIKTRSNEFTNSYTYLANQDKILLAKSGDDKVQLQVDGQGIDEHWAQINKSGIKTFISDHLGTVINSEVTNDLKITGAFREVLQATPEMEATTNPLIYGYTGRQFEPETGLYFYRNRVYDQNSGRFMTKDPMGVSAGDVNLYRYVGNRPLSSTDPTGFVSTDSSDGATWAWKDPKTGKFTSQADANVVDITPAMFIGAVFAMPVLGSLGSIAAIMSTPSITVSQAGTAGAIVSSTVFDIPVTPTDLAVNATLYLTGGSDNLVGGNYLGVGSDVVPKDDRFRFYNNPGCP